VANRSQLHRDELLDTWQRLLEAHGRLERVLGRATRERVDLSMSSVEVLMRLLNTPEHALPSTQMANEVSFTSGGFTKLADRLVAQGLIERRVPDEDRRRVVIALTTEGERRAHMAADALVATLERELRPLKRAELRGLRDTLRIVGRTGG
jgi:DNA-binding MarR family transcriptional regulator